MRNVFFIASLLLWGVTLRAATPTPVEVSPTEQISFEQEKAKAHLQELQERMFRLAELTRDLEPDDSARLLLAVQKAREELIIEQMKDAMTLLEKKDLGPAVGEQKELVRKLHELRELLTSTDMEFRIKLDRLRKLDAILKKLEPAIAEEKRQQDKSGDLAKKTDAEKKEFDAAQAEQERNRGATDAINQMVKELGPNSAEAAGELTKAGAAMGGAEGKLGEGKAGEAEGQQGEAAEAMKNAKDKLTQERDKLLGEVEKQVRDQVLASMTEMLEKQKKVREVTQTLSARAEAQDRAALLAVQRQAVAQDRIVQLAEQTVTLIDETHFSLALPAALRSVQRRMMYVSSDLKAGRAGTGVVATEKEIEKDLADLISAVKDSAPPDENNNKDQPPGRGQQDQAQKAENKLAAELKIIRLLQVRVNEETTDADGRRARAEADLSPETREKIGSVRDHQDQVRDTLDKVRRSANPNGG